jgi:3-oxoacyl-[acyl-carrier-protein] synthase-1
MHRFALLESPGRDHCISGLGAGVNMSQAIAVTGLGMRTSIGDDAIGSCAALRAGLNCAQELPQFTVLNEDGTPEHPTGHPVLELHGFQGQAKLLALGRSAIDELLSRTTLRTQPTDRLGLFLGLPPPSATRLPCGPESRKPLLAHSLTRLARLSVREELLREFRAGHAGLALALKQASQELLSERLDFCIVGGIDSLLQASTLQNLHDKRRLKSEDAPDGLQPGEAAAFILLERLRPALRRGAPVHAILGGATVTREEADEARRVPGVVLGRAVTALLGSSRKPENLWLISDINGEPGRALEYAQCLVRLCTEYPDLKQAPLWYPAASLGDTGAASASIGICAAVRAFAREYAPADAGLVLASSDGVERGAILVERFIPR